MGYAIKTFDDLVADMVQYLVANAPQITDLSPGSVIRSFCESAGLCMEEIYISMYLGFRRYLNDIPENNFGFERKGGVKATTTVVYSRTGSSGDAPIPEGTRLLTVSGLRFISAVGQIDDGETSSDPVEVTAEEVGTAYNVLSSTIVILEDDVAGVESVTNANAAVGGVDQETDYEYTKRFQAYIEGLGRCNLAGLEAGALGVDGITSVSPVELFPPVANVNVNLYIDDGSALGVSTAKVTEVQAVIDGDGTEENPGYRAAGVNVIVVKPQIVTQPVTATVTAISGVDTDQMEVDINTALTGYVNTLGVGNDIVYNELVSAIMGVYGVADCDVTVPTGNVTIAATQVGRLGVVTLNIV